MAKPIATPATIIACFAKKSYNFELHPCKRREKH